jgi:hypothetical protein
MLRLLAALALMPGVAVAATPAELARLHDALSTEALMAILSEEGIEQSEDLRDAMFPGRGGAGWTATAAHIYSAARLSGLFRQAFDEALQDTDAAPLLDFYEGETGALIARLEVDARRAIMAEDVEAAARNAFDALDPSSPRMALLEEFAELNDLVDRNVTGALNANLAFYRGLSSGEAFDMTEDDMLRDVWEQETEIREDTRAWVFGYMTFAYETLTDDQLNDYVVMADSPAGRALNRALFAGFDAIFRDVSYEMGQVTAQFSVGDEL